jgi:hypothetical protein
MTPEGKVKAKVNRALAEHFGARCFRFMPVQNGMGRPGVDYHCCIDGWAVFVETKVEGKTLTPRQQTTREEILAAGGLFFEIHNEDEIDQMIATIELHLKFAPNPRRMINEPTPDR